MGLGLEGRLFRNATDPTDQALAPIVAYAAAAGPAKPGACVLRIVEAARLGYRVDYVGFRLVRTAQ